MPSFKKIKKKDLKKVSSSAKSVHICSNNNSHIFYVKKYSKIINNIIVEKPLINSQKEFINVNKLYKKNNNIIVNYTDLFNPLFSKIGKIFKNNSKKKININIFYYSRTKKFNKKYELIYDFLDHPLSIILKIFKFFPKFKIIYFSSNYKNFFLQEKLLVQYNFLIARINFTIGNTAKRKMRKINIETNSNNYFFNLNTPLKKNKKNSFLNLYKTLNKKRLREELHFSFHKKIYKEKLKIINQLKKQKNNSNL